MTKPKIAFICVAAAMALVAAGLFIMAQVYLGSDNFQKQLVGDLSRTLQCEVRIEKISRRFGFQTRLMNMRICFLGGVDLMGIRVANDEVRPREFLKADRLQLRYDLFEALFHHRIVLDEFSIHSPNLKLDLSDSLLPSAIPTSGETAVALPHPPQTVSSERATSRSATAPARTAMPERTAAGQPPMPSSHATPSTTLQMEVRWPHPPVAELRSFAVENGSLALTLPDGEKLIVDGAHIEAAFSADPVPTGSGNIACETLLLPRKVMLNDARVNFLWRKDSIVIPKWIATLCGGSLEGSFKAERKNRATPFEARLTVNDVNLQELFQTLDLHDAQGGAFKGFLKAQSRFQGALSHPQWVSGQGQARVHKARLVNIQSLVLLAGYLNRPEFRDLPLQKCEADFLLQTDKLQVPRLEVVSSDIRLAGGGWVHLGDETQEFRLKLALSSNLVSQIAPAVVEGIDLNADGGVEFPFRTWGTLEHPQDDLQTRFASIATRAMGGAIFDKLFQMVSPQSK
ncbi:MAG: hypothetical protein HY360_14120 [Verrucomicrobia bacterium]|nr:hypothetical protein [Verrucomicrobiota bacterium]